MNRNLLGQSEDLRERIMDDLINEMQDHAVGEILLSACSARVLHD